MLKYILAVVVLALMVGGCTDPRDVSNCDRCEGLIAWHEISSGCTATRYRKDYELKDGKEYHKWCYETMNTEEGSK